MTDAEAPLVAVIGCGNPTRGDDGVGPEAIRLLRCGILGRLARNPPTLDDAPNVKPGHDEKKHDPTRRHTVAAPAVSLYDAGTDGMAVLFAARGCRRLIIIDACRSGTEPGAVFEVPAHELDANTEPTLGTHEFRWNHALTAGRAIFGDAFPTDTTVFLIEAETLAFGIGLSPPVSAAAELVAARIEASVLAQIGAKALQD
jgi:hydrogenase maturation protease